MTKKVNKEKPKQVFDFKRPREKFLIRGLRCLEGIDWWRLDESLDNLYSECSYFSFVFRTEGLPKRCELGYKILFNDFLIHMKTIKNRVHTNKIEAVVHNFVKNMSRVKWSGVFAMKFLGNNKHWSNPIINPCKLSYTIFAEMVVWLIDKGYVAEYKGSGGTGMINTTNMLVCSEELINLCTGKVQPKKLENSLKFRNKDNILIHQEVKGVTSPRNLLPEEEEEVIELDRVLSAYNESLENKTIVVCGHEIKEAFFRRIFNEDLNGGGRYYDHGEILSKSKEERSTTLIDGEPTVSLDFKHLHPSICYELKGLTLDDKDPYEVQATFEVNNTLISSWMETVGVKEVPNFNRNLAKLALLCMINAKDKKSCMAAISQEIGNDKNKRNQSKRKFVGVYDVKVKDLVDKLYDHNIDIKEYFYSGHGVVMQNLDSKMIDYCIRVFLSEDEVLIPVHDAIICRESLEAWGMDTMQDAYGFVLGSNNNCKIEIEKA